MESDLGTKLGVGIAHGNTDTRVCIPWYAASQMTLDLVISRDFISNGLRSRAADLVSSELAPSPSMKSAPLQRGRSKQSAGPASTRRSGWRHDDSLLRLDNPGIDGPQARRLAVGRLQKLERVGLATAARAGPMNDRS
jgi:type IV secretory pathway VirD2 relaxase